MTTQYRRHGEEIWRRRQQGESYAAIAADLGIPAPSARRIWQKVRDSKWGEQGGDESSFSFAEADDEATAVATAELNGMYTVDQIREALGLPDDYYLDSNVTGNVWGNDISGWNLQTKVRFKRDTTIDALPLLEDMRRDIREGVPTYDPPVIKRGEHRRLLECSIFDLHFGKASWFEETGQTYNMDIAERLFLSTIEQMAQMGEDEGVERFILVAGNDLGHVDNLQSTTTAGTPQDNDGHWREHFRRIRHMVKRGILRLHEVAPVDVLIVPGNHFRQSAYALGEALEDWFWNTDTVTVDNSPRERKYYRYGVNLLGFTHGNEEKTNDLPLIMANEAKAHWSDTYYREWHIGHYHKKRETRFLPVDEHGGIRVRVIPSLCATDRWHYMKGYVGNVRSAEAYLWDYDAGLVAQYSVNVEPEPA